MNKVAKCLSFMLIMSMVIMVKPHAIFAADGSEVGEVPAQVGEGEFVPDPQMLELIREKEQAVEEYMQNKKVRMNEANSISSITQHPQQTGNWCGYSALQSTLEGRGVYVEQGTIVNEIGTVTGFPYYDFNGNGCPWLMSNGDSVSQFPAAVYLNSKLGFMEYAPYPYGAAGATVLTEANLRARIMYRIDSGYGVMVCGESVYGKDSYMQGYYAGNVGHWFVIRGYKESGNKVEKVDPVANSPAVSWGGKVNPYEYITIANLTAFAQPRGIIY